jgi:hypothetical protein
MAVCPHCGSVTEKQIRVPQKEAHAANEVVNKVMITGLFEQKLALEEEAKNWKTRAEIAETALQETLNLNAQRGEILQQLKATASRDDGSTDTEVLTAVRQLFTTPESIDTKKDSKSNKRK